MIRRTVGISVAPGTASFIPWLRTQDAASGSDTTIPLPIHPPTASGSVARAVGQDGHILGAFIDAGVLGFYHYDPSTTTYIDLVDLSATDMDLSGRRIVGLATDNAPVFYEAILWDSAQGYRKLGTLPGGFTSIANGISASGRIVVGASESNRLALPFREAMRWHADTGMHPLEPFPANESRESAALATSDANLVVGWYRVGTRLKRAFLWTPREGRRDLQTYLVSELGLGPQLSGWVLEEATRVSADGKIIAGAGIDPTGAIAAWVVDLTDTDRAEARLRPEVSAAGESNWSLHLRCGDIPIAELYVGIIPSASFLYDDPFDFGDCMDTTVNPPFERHCTGASGIGQTVSESSFITLPLDSPIDSTRAATPYLHLIGDGGPANDTLCRPGDAEVLLGSLQFPEPTPELILNAIEAQVGLDDLGARIPDRHLRLIREREPGGVEVSVRPELGNIDGRRWMVSAEAPDAYTSFSFGLIVPPNASGVTFGSCFLSLGIDGRRECEDPDDLGTGIDYTAVRTVGPSANLVSFGLRPDAIYVYIGGQLPTQPLPSFNTPNHRTRLGVFEFDAINTGYAFVPTPTFEGVGLLDSYWSDFVDWTDNQGFGQNSNIPLSGTGYGTGYDPDWDGDGLEDADDRCPYVFSPLNLDDGTLEQLGSVPVSAEVLDNVGNECQCGDMQINHRVNLSDIDDLRDALLDSAFAATFTTAERDFCNSIGPVVPSVDSTTSLNYDCKINDVFTLLKARVGQRPLIPIPGEFPSCPDVFTP